MELSGNGAGDETRTRDIDLGRVALYQLSYYRWTTPVKRNRQVEEYRVHPNVLKTLKPGEAVVLYRSDHSVRRVRVLP
jgi:hypothetical protein